MTDKNTEIQSSIPKSELIERLGTRQHHKNCKWKNYIAIEFLPCPYCRIEVLTEENARLHHTWRPIETAPKDGLPLLLCTDGGIVFVGKRNKHLQLWVDDQGRERFRTVRHWMPLPAPPKL